MARTGNIFSFHYNVHPCFYIKMATLTLFIIMATCPVQWHLCFLDYDHDGNYHVKDGDQGWRKLDPGTGDEAGTTEGAFHLWLLSSIINNVVSIIIIKNNIKN